MQAPAAAKQAEAVEAIIGTWDFAYLNGFKNRKTFERDHTFKSGNKTGTWEVKATKIILRFPEGNEQAMFFPIDPKGTKGENHNHDQFVATRQ
jgi:hypothetical protein